jgi:methyl-accepting chemotaxis protein
MAPSSTTDPALGAEATVRDGASNRVARVAREERLVIGALVAVTLLMAAAIGAGLWISRELKRDADAGYADRAIPLLDATTDLALQMVNQETSVRGFTITGDDAALVPFETGRRAAQADLDRIAARASADPAIPPLLADARARIASLEQFFTAQVDLVRSGPAGRAAAQSRIDEGSQQFDRFRQTATALHAAAEGFVARTRAAQDDRYRELVLALAGLGIVAVALSGVLAVVMPRRIGRLLRALDAERSVSQLAEAGAQRQPRGERDADRVADDQR